MTRTLEFLFTIAIPLGLVVAVVVGLFGLGALFRLLDRPSELRQRIEAAFRRPPAPPKTPGPSHYYKPYWSGEK